jgi:oligopeptide/dipeptide ABC transporter ATP-binding protein
VLEVRDLRVSFGPHGREVEVVHGVDLCIAEGEIVGMVGESGSGKSVTAMAASALLPGSAHVSSSVWRFEGTDLAGAPRGRVADALGGKLAVVFQDPMSSLNPARRVGAQMTDVVRVHGGRSRREALADAVDRLRKVRIASPEQRVHDHPHRFSGGMRQRAMIAMGLMTTPSLLVADEPTTALDVTVQAEIMELIAELNRTMGTAVLLVSHNIALIAEVCARVLVMYAGRIVEELPAAELTTSARHPYTRALMDAVPRFDTSRSEPLATIPGQPPDPAEPTTGCPFAPRCPWVEDRCRVIDPPLVRIADGSVACHVAVDRYRAEEHDDADRERAEP